MRTTDRGSESARETLEPEQVAGPAWWNARTRVIVAAALIAAFVWLGSRYSDQIARLADADPWMVILLIIFSLISRMLESEVMHVALNVLNRHVSRFELFWLTFVRTYSNLLVPRAGLGAMGVYLKAKHGVSYADSVSLLLPTVVLHLVVIGALGLITQAILAGTPGAHASRELSVVFAVVLVVAIAGTVVRMPVSNEPAGRLMGFVRRLSLSWQRLGSSHRVVWRVLLVQTVQTFTRAAQVYVAFRALGIAITPQSALTTSLLADVMFVISLTPNALGFREAAIVYGASLTGVEPALSLAAAILDRLVTTIVVIIVAQIALLRIVRPKPQAN